jgi:hypothetical protein
MANSKLLKEAIADAKAVKETALANAKLALEEAFTPRLQSILSQKLRAEAEEVDNDETEKMQEELDSSDIGSKVGVNAAENPGKQPSLDASTDLSVGVKSKGGQVGSELSDYKKVKEISEEENPYGDDMEGDKDAEIAELKARLAELEGEDDEMDGMDDMGDENDMSDEFSMGDMGDMEGGSDDDFESDDSYDGEDSEDDMDLESIIRELEAQMSGDDSDQEEMPEDEPMGENYSDGSEAGTDKGETPKVVVTNEGDGENDDDVIDLEEILREMEADMKDDKEKVDEEEDKEEMKKDLQEAYKTIKSLQSTINEVNLLNAKLLFANKLFRAHNMTNEQKVKVIETLDRTKSVREVKLVYSTLAENFKYTSNTSKVAKKSITEGIASKVTKSTKPAASKQVIAESTNLSDRFKKLAGIIK